jgi:hypothetical protein
MAAMEFRALSELAGLEKPFMAEDEGFEPSRLSSTRVRDARTRPLCESSSAILG